MVQEGAGRCIEPLLPAYSVLPFINKVGSWRPDLLSCVFLSPCWPDLTTILQRCRCAPSHGRAHA